MTKTISIIVGIIFIIFGVLGMIGSGLFGANGYFMTNGIHDWIHLLTGVVLLIVAFGAAKTASMTMKVLGIIYIIVAILGFIMTNPLGIVMTTADNWLHVVLAIVLFFFGWHTSKSGNMMMSSSQPTM
jgi:hypothetical protein